MNRSRQLRAAEIFDECCELDPAQRDARLAEVAIADAELKRDVEKLLEAHANAGSFLDEGAAAYASQEMAGSLEATLAGTRIGPYRLVRELGRGGMGVVYLAERSDDQFELQVALKLIQDRFHQEAFQMFQRERQLLANLKHPHIARLLDGGISNDDRPYLVMEYVNGQPIDEHCQNRDLSVQERIHLFLQACDAVEHAHQNLVVHRDLKPGNILVDREGGIKLLDFGIAKVIDPASSEDTTNTVAPRMTPRYASPEQVSGASVTTLADVYSLGVVLYELLTGRSPYGESTSSRVKLEHAITRGELPRASFMARAVLARSASGGNSGNDEAPSDSSHGMARRFLSLPGALRRDLDMILWRALAVESKDRYASARDFADDLRACLEHRPIRARAPSLRDVATRFARRNPVATLASLLAVLGLLAGFLISHRARLQEEIQRERAEELFRSSLELNTSLFTRYVDRIKELPGSSRLTVDMIQELVTSLELLHQQAPEDSTTAYQLGNAYFQLGDALSNPNRANLGDQQAGLVAYEKARHVAERLHAKAPDDERHPSLYALVLDRIGQWHLSRGEFDESMEVLRQAWSVLQDGPESDATSRVSKTILVRLGRVAGLRGNHTTALEYLQEALPRAQDRFAATRLLHDHLAVADTHLAITSCYLNLERYEDALTEMDVNVEIVESICAKDPDNAAFVSALAMGLEVRARAFRALEEPELAKDDLLRALDLLDELRMADPDNRQLLLLAANVTFGLGECNELSAESFDESDEDVRFSVEEARSWFEQCQQLCEEMIRRGAQSQEQEYVARCREKILRCDRRLRVLAESLDEPAQ